MKRLLIAALAALSLSACATVGTGQRGVVLNQHRPTGEIKTEGFYFYNFLTDSIVEMTVQSQTLKIPLTTSTIDNQHIKTEITVQYSVDPSKTPQIYDQTLDDYQDRWILPAISASFTNEIGRLHAPDLNGNRTDIQNKIDKDLKQLLNPRGVLISQVYITGDFEFTDANYEQSISHLAAAKNDALTATQEGKAKVNRARAEAEAQNLQHGSLTPTLLQKEALDNQRAAIEKWDGKMPTYAGGQLPMITVPVK